MLRNFIKFRARIIIFVLIIFLVSGLLYSNLKIRAGERVDIKIFPTSYAGDWQNPQAALLQDLNEQAAFENFNQENSAFLSDTTSTSISVESATSTAPTLEFFDFNVAEKFTKNKIENVKLRLSLAAKGGPEDKLKIEYFYQNTWQDLNELVLVNEFSNATNGDYRLYALPTFENWQDLENLRVRFTYFNNISGNLVGSTVYLDALWLEINYQPQEQVAPKQEESQPQEELQPQEKQQPVVPTVIEISFIDPKISFREDEEPQFKFALPQTNVTSTPQAEIEGMTLIGPDQQAIAADIILIGAEDYKVKIKKPSNWQPGQYILTIRMRRGDEIYQAKIEFYWQEVIPKRIIRFFIDQLPLKTKNNLGQEKENDKINVRIINQRKNSSLVFEGACQKEYFVILAYVRAEDYQVDPSRFIYNKAFPCQNGSYYFELKDLPDRLKDNTYYFLVAEQGQTGSWQPITAIQPVRVSVETH